MRYSLSSPFYMYLIVAFPFQHTPTVYIINTATALLRCTRDIDIGCIESAVKLSTGQKHIADKYLFSPTQSFRTKQCLLCLTCCIQHRFIQHQLGVVVIVIVIVFISRCTFIRLRVGVSVYESQICKMDSSRNDLKCYKKVYIYENHFHYE